MTIQARFRRYSARLFYLRAKRALALQRAREFLALMGVALDAPEPDEYVRAHVLAGQAEKQLRLEQGYTAQARRSSKLFDRSVAPFLDAAGRTVAEAFILMHNLERACKVQMAIQASGQPVHPVPHDVAERTAMQYESGSNKRLPDQPDPNAREWLGFLKRLEPGAPSSFRD